MTRAHLHDPDVTDELASHLEQAGIEPGEAEDGLVFVQRVHGLESFDDVEAEMIESFRLTKRAANADASIVYVIRSADLLGQRGALTAMLATGLLSAARSMGMEGRRDGRAANAVALDEQGDPAVTALWIATLLSQKDVTGELVTIGSSHLGKALP